MIRCENDNRIFPLTGCVQGGEDLPDVMVDFADHGVITLFGATQMCVRELLTGLNWPLPVDFRRKLRY